ncbi:hypothetical protein M758_8G118800 [Ceratodon purpureus]|uniref:Uncharacterized protein n=1 Tax=Ceratodon purpureus TaxID=3225 RepID=A0A8T0H1G9_CERPU|nr:hypothetical protein KC19_8G122300 [Ceratodon purpureus]KAG0608605.1 hypothetical protein M758_8G118800 [Ceratodon purpureus]
MYCRFLLHLCVHALQAASLLEPFRVAVTFEIGFLDSQNIQVLIILSVMSLICTIELLRGRLGSVCGIH